MTDKNDFTCPDFMSNNINNTLIPFMPYFSSIW